MKKDCYKCVECASLIDRAAVVCLHCKSYQNWRRFIPLVNTTIALVVALISVMTLSFDKVSILYRNVFLDKEGAVFHLKLNKVDSKKATITVKNFGEREIIVPKGFICQIPMVEEGLYLESLYTDGITRYPFKKEVSQTYLLHYMQEEDRPIVLNPEEMRVINYPLYLRRQNIRPSDNSDLFPKLKDDDDVPGYCLLIVEDTLGRPYDLVLEIRSIDIFLYQDSILETPYFQREE